MAVGVNEYAIFPMAYLNITQGMEEGSHIGSFAIDIAGKGRGIEPAFAPFTGTIKKKWPNGNTIWLESNLPVEWADGNVDYMTVSMTHDNNIDNLHVGQVIQQGVNFYSEGTAGIATGNHIHLGVGRGKFTGTGWYQNKYGYWVINNEVRPYDALFLSGTEVINGKGYPWKSKGEDMTAITREQVLWHYRLISGNEPTEVELNAYTGGDYVKVTEEIKQFFANSGQGYNQYKSETQKEIKRLEKELETATGDFEPAGELFKRK